MSVAQASRIILLAAATFTLLGAPSARGDDEEIVISYHPPHLVYFQEATAPLRRSVTATLRRFCDRRGADRPSPKDMGLGYETFIAFCENVPVRVFMGINHRRRFNSQILICRKDALQIEEDEKVEIFPASYSDAFTVGMRCIGMSRGESGYDFYETRP